MDRIIYTKNMSKAGGKNIRYKLATFCRNIIHSQRMNRWMSFAYDYSWKFKKKKNATYTLWCYYDATIFYTFALSKEEDKTSKLKEAYNSYLFVIDESSN